VRIHGRVGIKVHQPGTRNGAFNGGEMLPAVHPLQTFLRDDRGVHVLQEADQTRCDELILHCLQACRLFRVMGAHVVQQAIRMREKCDGHDAPDCMRVPESVSGII
jgi:hypothetical protein